MIGWGIALAVLAAIWFFPFGIRAHYDAAGPELRVIVGLLRLRVYPRPKKERKKKPKKQPKKAAAPREQPKQEPQKSGGSLTDFLPLAKKVLELMTDFRKALRVNVLELRLTMAGGAPDQLAVNYGRAWAAIGGLDGTLEELFTIRRKILDVQCDFCGSTTTVYGHLELTITVGRLLHLGIRHSIRLVPELLQILKKRKGGVTK